MFLSLSSTAPPAPVSATSSVFAPRSSAPAAFSLAVGGVATNPPTNSVVRMVKDMTANKARVPKPLADAIVKVVKEAVDPSQLAQAIAMTEDSAMKELLIVSAANLTSKVLDGMTINNNDRNQEIWDIQPSLKLAEEELFQGTGSKLNEALLQNREDIN